MGSGPARDGIAARESEEPFAGPISGASRKKRIQMALGRWRHRGQCCRFKHELSVAPCPPRSITSPIFTTHYSLALPPHSAKGRSCHFVLGLPTDVRQTCTCVMPHPPWHYVANHPIPPPLSSLLTAHSVILPLLCTLLTDHSALLPPTSPLLSKPPLARTHPST
jgi:hypothetical protein